MTTYNITVGGSPYAITTTDSAQIAALAAARVARNNSMPATVKVDGVDEANPDLFADDTAYLQSVLSVWKASNSDGDVAACAAQCLASYAGQGIPEPTPEVISPEAAKAQLMAYANAKQGAIEVGGVTISGVPVSTTDGGRIELSGAVSLAQLVPDHVFDWVTPTGKVSLTASQVIGVGQAVGLWVQTTYTALGNVIDAIIAGSITTKDQIDAAAWPGNSK